MRKVFFSFDFDRDHNRAGVVRNSNVVEKKYRKNDFQDGVAWEEVKIKGEKAIKDWIDNQLIGTSVTCVLIGKETCKSKYVRYELQKSFERGNGIFGVYIHKIENLKGFKDTKGDTTFGDIFTKDGKPAYFFELFKTYDWKDDDGYNNFGDWVEKAAKEAGK